MRRFDPLTSSFFMLPLEADRLPNFTRPRPQLQEPEAFENFGEEPIHSWETAWIDLGGEG